MNRPASYITLLLGCIWVLVATPHLYAQQSDPYIDSLKRLLDLHPEEDSNFVMTGLKLASSLKFSDPKQAEIHAQKALTVSQRLNDQKLQAQAFNILGIVFAIQNDYGQSIFHFQQAMEYARNSDFLLLVAQIHNNIGNIYKSMADYPASLAAYEQAEKLYDSLGYSPGLALASNNMGNLYKRIGEPAEARLRFENALREYRKQNNASGYASAQLNLGIFLKDYPESMETAKLLLDSAYQYYSDKQQTSKEVIALNSLGSLYIELEDYEKAKSYLLPALVEAKRLKLIQTGSAILSNLAKIASAQGDHTRSIELADQVYHIADSMENNQFLLDAESLRSTMFQQAGRWKEALEHYKYYVGWRDSIFNEQQAQLYEAQKVRQEVFEREEQLKAQALKLSFLEDQVSLENKWKWSLAAASLFLFFAGVLYFQKYRDRKVVAAELEARNKLIGAQKAEIEALDKTKSRFFTNISHEFRTPLNLILGPLRSGKEQIPTPELGMMQQNAERLLRLINQLMDLSKLETGLLEIHYENANLYPYLRNLASAFFSQAKRKNINYQLDIPATEQFVQLDPGKLEQIIYNLLSNAFKFTPEGGSVSFHASLEDGYKLRFTVSDTGLGVPEDLQDKIFDRFYQVDGSSTRAFEGTGIGLSLTKELIELHGGSISIDSQEGQGCRFTVILPLKPFEEEAGPLFESASMDYAEISEPIALVATTEQETSDKPLLLVVEDHTDLRHYLINQLAGEYQFLEAADGEAGLALALEKVPDIIITDVMMPRMDGVELIKRIKNDTRTSHIPVIMLTAKNDLETRQEGFETGADQYLAKPFDPPEIRARLKSVFTQTQRLQEKYSQAIYLKPTELEIQDHEAQFLQKLMDIIETHLDNSEFSVSQLQEEIGMSRMQLHRKLKALSGKSASEFIRHFRLQRAAELLKHPGAQVADVAYRVGFSHLSYFAKAFKEQFGQVPSAYLKQASQQASDT